MPRHWRQWEAPATTGEARGGAAEAGGSPQERRAPSCQRAGAAAGLLGKVPMGGRARAGDRVRGGAAGSLCDPGQRASPPWANSGAYNISIKQGMRDNPIMGIERVGVRIISY